MSFSGLTSGIFLRSTWRALHFFLKAYLHGRIMVETIIRTHSSVGFWGLEYIRFNQFLFFGWEDSTLYHNRIQRACDSISTCVFFYLNWKTKTNLVVIFLIWYSILFCRDFQSQIRLAPTLSETHWMITSTKQGRYATFSFLSRRMV